jgi:flagellar hook-basal body complex protein FliE
MIQSVGNGGASLAQTAIEAALKAHADASRRIERQLAEAGGASSPAQTAGADFGKLVGEGLRSAEAQVQRIDELPRDMVVGKVSDFHEIAAQIKQSELTFKFALEVRNKLIDAYRETMRMSV